MRFFYIPRDFYSNLSDEQIKLLIQQTKESFNYSINLLKSADVFKPSDYALCTFDKTWYPLSDLIKKALQLNAAKTPPTAGETLIPYTIKIAKYMGFTDSPGTKIITELANRYNINANINGVSPRVADMMIEAHNEVARTNMGVNDEAVRLVAKNPFNTIYETLVNPDWTTSLCIGVTLVVVSLGIFTYLYYYNKPQAPQAPAAEAPAVEAPAVEAPVAPPAVAPAPNIELGELNPIRQIGAEIHNIRQGVPQRYHVNEIIDHVRDRLNFHFRQGLPQVDNVDVNNIEPEPHFLDPLVNNLSFLFEFGAFYFMQGVHAVGGFAAGAAGGNPGDPIFVLGLLAAGGALSTGTKYIGDAFSKKVYISKRVHIISADILTKNNINAARPFLTMNIKLPQNNSEIPLPIMSSDIIKKSYPVYQKYSSFMDIHRDQTHLKKILAYHLYVELNSKFILNSFIMFMIHENKLYTKTFIVDPTPVRPLPLTNITQGGNGYIDTNIPIVGLPNSVSPAEDYLRKQQVLLGEYKDRVVKPGPDEDTGAITIDKTIIEEIYEAFHNLFLYLIYYPLINPILSIPYYFNVVFPRNIGWFYNVWLPNWNKACAKKSIGHRVINKIVNFFVDPLIIGMFLPTPIYLFIIYITFFR